MGKILIISSSPRKNGNSEMLCGEFARGAVESGNEVEKIRLSEKKIGYCINCDVCKLNKTNCVIMDDSQEIIQKILDCDALVFATPVYFSNVCAQLKTLIDRFYAREKEFWEKPEKKLYYIITNDAPDIKFQDSTIAALNGFTEYLRVLKLTEIISGVGCSYAGEIKDMPAMSTAYEAGKNV